MPGTDGISGEVEFRKGRAPTLYFIITIKLLKGTLLVLLALGFYSLSDNNLPEEFRRVLDILHIDPEKKFFADLAAKLGHITPANVISFAVGTGLYSLFSLVEGVGLIFRVSWAAWLAIGEAAFFIPIEVYELVHNGLSLTVAAILALNILIFWYLLANRHRLFRHHHHPHHGPA